LARSSARRGPIGTFFTILEMGDQAWQLLINTLFSKVPISGREKLILKLVQN
jgi:hypothetical protein